MDAIATPQALEALRHGDDPLRDGVGLVHLTQLAGEVVPVDVPIDLLEAGLERGVAAHHQRGHGLGHAVPRRIVVAEHPGGVAHGCPRLDGGEGDDLRHMVRAVPIGGVLDHVASVALIEVHVDVRHLLSAGVQEALEEQVVLDRVEVHDPKAVGHAAPGRRSTTGSDADVLLLGVADQVPHDEEVGREAHVGDDAQLVVEALDHLVGERRPIALPGALVGELAQVLRRPVLGGAAGDLLWHRELRQARLAELELDVRPLGDQEGRVAGGLVVLEQVAHLGRRLEVVLRAVELEPLLVCEQRTGLHAQQGIVGLGVAPMGVVAVVGGEQRSADGVGDLDQLRVGLDLLRQAVILQLDEEVALAEDLLEPRRPSEGLLLVAGEQRLEHDATEAPGRRDQALGVLGQQLPVHAGLVVVALEVRRGRELEEVLVALGGLGEQGQVVVELVPAVGVAPTIVDLPPAHRTLES